MLIIFPSYAFSLSVTVFKISAENGKNAQNLGLNANDSYKELSDDFDVTECFVELDLLNIVALYSFSLSVIVLEILAKNRKIRQNLCLNANNSYKDSSNDFGVTETFVELDLLQFLSKYYRFQDIEQKLQKSSKFTFSKESSDDFNVTETFVELDLLNNFALYSFSLSVIEILAKNRKNHQNLRLNANNSYKDSSDDFGVMETFVELDLLIIFASYSFSLSVIVFKILAENGKNRQNSHLKANNSYKESSDDFGVMETFVELDLLNNFALYSFSLSVIVLEILAKNRKNHQNLRLNASNSYKESSDDFGATETFVELDLLNIFVLYSSSLSVIVLEI